MTQIVTAEDQVPGDDGGYIRRSISLYPEQDATVFQFAKDSGLENYSAALRMIINEWRKLKLEQLQTAKRA